MTSSNLTYSFIKLIISIHDYIKKIVAAYFYLTQISFITQHRMKKSLFGNLKQAGIGTCLAIWIFSNTISSS